MEESSYDVLLQTEAALFGFLVTELDLSITFATIANGSSEASKRKRNLDNAEKGYVTVLRYMDRGGLIDEHAKELLPQLELLKAMLVEMGKIAPA